MAIAKKKKKFFDVQIPLISKTTQLYAYSREELKGRCIKYDLTRILRGKNAILRLKVTLDKEELTTFPIELKLLPFFLKKMVRKGTNYVESSFSTPCKDTQLRIKPLLITRRKVSRAVRKALREKSKELLIEHVKNKTTETLFQELLKNHLQKTLSLKLKKIYPLSLCEIRVFKVEKTLEKKPEKKKETK
ncbi:MAG: hypothetical protein ABIH59_00785 [archaeon]